MAHQRFSTRGNKMLITIKIVGSPGPIRLLVDSDDSIAAVISHVLKEYGRQRRLPMLGDDPSNFDLCCSCIDGALSSGAAIGSTKSRNFSMIKKVTLNSCEALGSNGCPSFLMKMKKIHFNGSIWDSKLSKFTKKKSKARLRLLFSNLIPISSH